jgi:hypothetical protein
MCFFVVLSLLVLFPLPPLFFLTHLCVHHRNPGDHHQLLFNCADAFGTEMVVEQCIPLIQTLSENPSFRVRKAIAARLGSLSKQVGDQIASTTLVGSFHVYLSFARVFVFVLCCHAPSSDVYC